MDRTTDSTPSGDTARTDDPGDTARPDEPRSYPAWEQRFRAPRISLPRSARDVATRATYVSNASGTFEVYAWDRESDTHRQVTAREHGTFTAQLDPDGERIWWFDDTSGDEFGVWRAQPFHGGSDDPVHPKLAPSYPSGLALGRRLAVVGRSTDAGASVEVIDPNDAAVAPRVIYQHKQDAHVGGLDEAEQLVVVVHSERGDSLKPALRVLNVEDGSTIAELDDGPGRGLWSAGFSKRAGDTRLLVQHERAGMVRPLLWDPVRGAETELPLDLPGEVRASWYPEGTALLLTHAHRGRTTLHRLDLASGVLHAVCDRPGTVTDATVRPGGLVEYAFSSAATPTAIYDGNGRVVLAAPEAPLPSAPVVDVDADGPGGGVHALLARPAGDPPYPCVFLLHGGPMYHDSDAFAGDRAAYVDHGVAVVQVNYRGSTGYGSPWQDAIIGRPGLTELEDVAAVRDRLVADGVIDPARVVVAGGSWGGYLTLLALGTQPLAWAGGVAAVPVADYVTAYDDEMDALKAVDRSLFGGSPSEVPERYAASSPLTYVSQVRAPVLVLAGDNDPRCPLRQVETYLAALSAAGVEHEVYRFDAGHGSLVVDERIRQMRAELAFALKVLGLGPVQGAAQ